MDENDVVSSRIHLEEQGLGADAYGVPVKAISDTLVRVARDNVIQGSGCTGLRRGGADHVVVPVVCDTASDRTFDLDGIDMLGQLWFERKLPRDCYRADLERLLDPDPVWFDAAEFAARR